MKIGEFLGTILPFEEKRGKTMKIKYKACIFDMDGTVLDTLSTIAYYGNRALKHFGFPEQRPEDYKEFAGNGAKVLVHRMLSAASSDTEENFGKVYPYYVSLYETDTAYLTAPYEGISEMLCALRERGVKCAVLTNKPNVAAQSVLFQMFLPEDFALCVGQTEKMPIKPAPDGALYIAHTLGVKPFECLYVGDTWVDMDTGKNAGMDTVGVLWGFRGEDELRSHGAKYMIKKPIELIDILEENE